MRYYTSGCPDWSWCYKYDYPPLLSDLIKYVPYFDTNFINTNNAKKSLAVSPLVQLSYVLPRSSMYLLPDILHRHLINKFPDWYRSDFPLLWAFCKYIWEAHVQFPDIDINELSKTVHMVKL